MAPDDPDGVAPSDTDGVAPNDSPWSGVIDQEDERTAGAQAVLDAYVANDPESVAAWFADDANIGFNKERVDKATFIANISKDHTHFKDIEVSSVITTLRYNNGSVFTNLWACWEGTVRETGEELSVPVYMWMTWKDGKVTNFVHMFDPAPFVAALESIGVEPY